MACCMFAPVGPREARHGEEEQDKMGQHVYSPWQGSMVAVVGVTVGTMLGLSSQFTGSLPNAGRG